MFSEDICRYIDAMKKSIEEHPNIRLGSVLIQHPDTLPSKGSLSESFVSFAIYPITPAKDIVSLNSYVDEILLNVFEPDPIKHAQKEKVKSHIPSLGFSINDNVRLPLLSFSKEYLLSTDDNVVVEELYGNNIHLVRGFGSDTFMHRINYDIIVFPDSDTASQFVPKSHRFGEPYIAPMSIFKSSD